jgi:hypothetical protein
MIAPLRSAGCCQESADESPAGCIGRLIKERDEARAQLATTRHEWIVPEDHAILPMSDFTALWQAAFKLHDLVAANRLVLGEFMGPEYVRRLESESMAALRRSRMDEEGSDE